MVTLKYIVEIQEFCGFESRVPLNKQCRRRSTCPLKIENHSFTSIVSVIGL